jgi:hypothetical protein
MVVSLHTIVLFIFDIDIHQRALTHSNVILVCTDTLKQLDSARILAEGGFLSDPPNTEMDLDVTRPGQAQRSLGIRGTNRNEGSAKYAHFSLPEFCNHTRKS